MTPSNKTDQHEPPEISRHHLAAPKPELKEQVLQAAREAWGDDDQSAEDISWHRPILGLAASITIAITLSFAANMPHQNSSGPDTPMAKTTLSAGSPWLSAAAAFLPPQNTAEGLSTRLDQLHAMLEPDGR